MNSVVFLTNENKIPPIEFTSALSSSSIALFKKRYFILLLFCLCSMSNAFQWIEYAIITDKITQFYSIENFSVNLTSIIFMIIYIPGIFPASWILEKKRLRFAMLLGSFGTFFGSLVKCLSVNPTMFWLTMTGQSIVAASQLFILNLPSRISAIWFGKEEVSLATSIGVFGNQLGITLGFFLPPYIVSADPRSPYFSYQLKILTFVVTIFTFIVFIFIFTFFEDCPKQFPSQSQAKANLIQKKRNYFKSVQYLLKNINVNFLILSYGINIGIFYAISTILNQLIASSFPNQVSSAGDIGAILTISGTLGSFVCGFILNKVHHYKLVITVIYFFSFVGLLAFLLSLNFYLTITYFVAGFLGFFMTGYLAIGLDYAAEICYPCPEGTSAGFLNMSAQVIYCFLYNFFFFCFFFLFLYRSLEFF